MVKGMLSFPHSRSGGLIVLDTIRNRVLHVLPFLGGEGFHVAKICFLFFVGLGFNN